MSNSTWFPDLEDDFEESVRIDREERDHRRKAIESYHVTADSKRFIEEFVARLLGHADDMRTGSNYWLYGYYGSGKSHLLTVLDGLMDTEWLGNHEEVWNALVPEAAHTSDSSEQLHSQWNTVHDEYHVVPISVNLLKYQGQKERSFSEIILGHAHQNPHLTGIDDDISSGLSSQLEVAYFEDWCRTTDMWPDRQRRAADILHDITREPTNYDWRTDELWSAIQRYGALADVVLPKLFEEVTGTKDGYTDLQPSDIDPEAAVSRLENLRKSRETALDKPIKLLVLLDEVSLFIGADFGRLTELQTLAENVDDIGDGDIQLVATAQAKIEDVRPRFAAHGADFSIVKDRFPHRYQLPSKHVGEIAKRRLLEKSKTEDEAVRRVLDEANVQPAESLVYNDVRQNTNPPLDTITMEELVKFYPFLPYHAPLFLEILFNLRREASDPAKSIFSGTARAILALMHGLLQNWVEAGESDHLVSLVDFYELIKPELRDILTQDMRVIEGSETTRGIEGEVRKENLTEFDLTVAKAVVLLQHVHDIVPLTEGNIAVALMDDLNGRSWTSTTNDVEESLGRLSAFIRPAQEESGPRYRFATQEERIIYAEAQKNEANPDWEGIVRTLDDYLWERLVQDLSLPESVPYGDSDEEYPVSYRFSFDGMPFETTVETDGGLDVHIHIRGLRPDTTTDTTTGETLQWSIDTGGLANLRDRLIGWWAHRDALATNEAPPAVERDIEQRASTVRSGLVSAMQNGSYTVKDRGDISGLGNAVQTAADVAYPPDFHPALLHVNDDRLRELSELRGDEELPAWAQKIQVPSSNGTTNRGNRTIQNNVLSLTGRQLTGRDDGLTMTTVLNGIVEQKPFYDEARPALRAIIWGFCREGRLLPVDENGNTLENESMLDSDRQSTRLKLLDVVNIGDILEKHGFKKTTETVADGLITLRECNQRLQSKITGLREDVRLVCDTDIHSAIVSALLKSFADELGERSEETANRLATITSQDDELETAIERTNDAREWFAEVSDVWDRRLSSLYRLDALLTVGDERFEWVGDDARSSVVEQRESVAAFEGAWWTTDDWSTFSGTFVPGLAADLGRSWNEFTDERGLRKLVEEIDGHPWVVAATDLLSGVHATFEREFITPFCELQRWYETLDNAMDSLSDGDSEDFIDASEAVSKLEPLGNTVSVALADLDGRLDRLNTTVGERTPADIDQIGLLPGDRQRLETRLEGLVEEHEIAIEEIETGVIVR